MLSSPIIGSQCLNIDEQIVLMSKGTILKNREKLFCFSDSFLVEI